MKATLDIKSCEECPCRHWECHKSHYFSHTAGSGIVEFEVKGHFCTPGGFTITENKYDKVPDSIDKRCPLKNK